MNEEALAHWGAVAPKEMQFLKATHWLPLYLAHRMSEVKDGTSRQTDALCLEDVSRPHRRRTLRVALAVHC